MYRSPARFLGATLAAVALVLTSSACEKPSPPPGGSPTPADDGADPPPTDPPPADPPPADPPPTGARQAAVPADHTLHARFEGTDFPNDCKADSDCHATGCSSEVCSADAGVNTMCDVLPVSLPADTQCGCVKGQCIWWNKTGATLPAAAPPSAGDPSAPGSPAGEPRPGGQSPGEGPSGGAEPAPGDKPKSGDKPSPDSAPPKGDCGGKTCKAPKTCIEYYGIAGPRGPKLYSCELRCTPGKGGCPKGQKCTTVADGPGSVCR
ncbi:MAG: hypothetical protein AAGF11_03025 [Myxococcota bacterium]